MAVIVSKKVIVPSNIRTLTLKGKFSQFFADSSSSEDGAEYDFATVVYDGKEYHNNSTTTNTTLEVPKGSRVMLYVKRASVPSYAADIKINGSTVATTGTTSVNGGGPGYCVYVYTVTKNANITASYTYHGSGDTETKSYYCGHMVVQEV